MLESDVIRRTRQGKYYFSDFSRQCDTLNFDGQWAKLTVCATTIYDFIQQDKASGGSLYKHLATEKPTRNVQAHQTLGQIIRRISIDERPFVVNEKVRIGDWERGLNENHNGLIRQYLPKGMVLDKVTDEEIRLIQNKLNNRPRKWLGYKTPNEVYDTLCLAA